MAAVKRLTLVVAEFPSAQGIYGTLLYLSFSQLINGRAFELCHQFNKLQRLYKKRCMGVQ